jgi:hypothetical protein
MKLHYLVALGVITMAGTTTSYADTPAHYSRISDYKGMAAPDAPLAQTLPPLTRAAETGDAGAMGRIYAGLSKCRALRRNLDQGDALAYCEGVPEVTIQMAGDYLARAASLGDPNAQYVYALAGTQELSDSTAGRPSGGEVRAYQAKAEGYLAALSKQCNVSAIQQIYRERRDGRHLLAADLPAAYAMLQSLSMISPSLVSEGDFTALENLMIPSDIAPAREAGVSFVNEHCGSSTEHA